MNDVIAQNSMQTWSYYIEFADKQSNKQWWVFFCYRYNYKPRFKGN